VIATAPTDAAGPRCWDATLPTSYRLSDLQAALEGTTT